MSRSLVLSLTLTSLVLVSGKASAFLCSGAFDVRFSERSFLERLDLERMEIESLSELSFGVYKVRLAHTDQQIVVRLDGKHQDLPFQRFVHHFFEESGRIETPVVRHMKASAGLIDHLSKIAARRTIKIPGEVQAIENLKSGAEIAVTTFWEDLRFGLDRHVGERALSAGTEFKPSLFEAELTKEQLRDLSDLWALSTVFGIDDLHTSNWGFRGARIVSVDSALRGRLFNSGEIQEFFNSSLDPFGGLKIRAESRDILLENISPEMQAYIRKLGPFPLLRTAKEEGLSLDRTQMLGILGRRDFLLELLPRN